MSVFPHISKTSLFVVNTQSLVCLLGKRHWDGWSTRKEERETERTERHQGFERRKSRSVREVEGSYRETEPGLETSSLWSHDKSEKDRERARREVWARHRGYRDADR